MRLKKHAATAALLVVVLTTGALFSSCGGDDTIPVSSAHSGGPGQSDADDAALQSGADKPDGDSALESDGGKPADNSAPENDGGKPADNAVGSGAGSEGAAADSVSDDSYFDDAVFIGDSLTEGFQLHGGITNATYYGFKNLNVKEVFEKPLVKSGSGKITISDALRKNDFAKYYIMLGANELGWVYPEVFTNKYGELIDLIREENPEAKIYLQSVLPVSDETSRTNKYYSNDRINYYDELISALADEKGVTYLNVRESVQNEKGVLPDEAATDGVHLNKDYCRKWADYLREHK